MRHDEHVRLMKQLIAHLGAGTNVDAGGLRRLDTSVYTDPEVAADERQVFLLGTPHIGMSNDLPEPGAFLTDNDLGVPILATRETDGIRDEHYVMGESQQTAANAGAPDQIVVGRNEPALHHYHNTYAAKLGREPLPLVDAIGADSAVRVR
jgi:hypothetical protein